MGISKRLSAADQQQSRNVSSKRDTKGDGLAKCLLFGILLVFVLLETNQQKRSGELMILSSLSSGDNSILPSCSSTTTEKEATPSNNDDFPPGKLVALVGDCQAVDRISASFSRVYEQGMWGAKLQPLDAFYSDAHWPPKPRKSASGSGSDLGLMTSEGLRVVKEVIRTNALTTMMDIPCGDVNWILDSVETDHTLKAYVGLDVVPQLIDMNQKRFRHHSNKVFHCLLYTSPSPRD